MSSSKIVEFYSGQEPDHRGRYLRDIQQWPDERLETVHDYIQWLFPLPERSGFNLDAPVLNHESINEFRARPELQDSLRRSFMRMMGFYGFTVRFSERITVIRAADFANKAERWLSPGNHNHLRLTRILRCLSLLGLEAEAKALLNCLSAIYDEENLNSAISSETFEYWRRATDDIAGS